MRMKCDANALQMQVQSQNNCDAANAVQAQSKTKYKWDASANAKAIVETPRQVYLILGVSVVMGAAFGFIFGFLDVEDASRGWDLRQALLNEEKYCYPLGLILGAIAAVINDRLGRNDTDYDPISQHDHFDDDDF